MGFNPVKPLISFFDKTIVGSALKGDKNSSSSSTSTSSSTSADDVAREEERRRLLSRGLSPLTATTPLGDQSTANIGRKALLGV